MHNTVLYADPSSSMAGLDLIPQEVYPIVTGLGRVIKLVICRGLVEK